MMKTHKFNFIISQDINNRLSPTRFTKTSRILNAPYHDKPLFCKLLLHAVRQPTLPAAAAKELEEVLGKTMLTL